MATLLRRSGNLARYSRGVAEYAVYTRCLSIRLRSQSRPSSFINAHRVRSYATVNQNDPEPQKNGKDAKGSSDKAGSNEKPKYALTEEEIEEIEHIARQLKKTLPPSRGKIIDETVEMLKKEGYPDELKALIKDHIRGKPISLASAARLGRLFANHSLRARVKIKAEELGMKYTEKGEKSQENLSSEQQGESETKAQRSEREQQRQEVQPEQQEQRQKQQDKHQSQQKWQQNKKQNGENEQQNRPQVNVFGTKVDLSTFLVTAILSYYLYRSVNPAETTKDITWQEFRTTFFDKGLVEKLTVFNRNRVRVELHREAVASMYPESPASQPHFYYYFTIGSVEAFERNLDEAHRELGIPSNERIPVAYADEVPIWPTLLSLGPTLFLIGSLFWLSRRAGGAAGGQSGIFGIGKSRARRFNHETDIKVKFSDVAGMDEAKVEIMEFVSFLKKPEKFQRLGAKIPRGAILSGPPGTGKTLLAKATAGESGVPFYSVSGSEFVEMFVGVGPSRVRDLFATARKNTPCIIFIDEIDAIGRSRAKQNFGGGNDERESTLNQILTEMDGFNTSDQVVVLAGTNRPDILDKALMRPGRFDRHIVIDRPTMEGRKQIFGVHLKKIVTNEDMEYLKGRLAALTPGFSGADIANCVNEAALVAARVNADYVSMKHFEQAIERVIGGLEKKSLVLSPEEKRTVAYHEAGHAICGWYFRYADPLLKVSIIPRGQGALGYAQYLPAQGDTYLLTRHQLMDRMAMTLGGRVSEELHFDTVTSGASDDFNKVTRMATAMVTKFGMSPKIGHVYFDEEQQQFQKPFSEQTARDIDEEVRRIVDEAYKQCRDLLTEKRNEIRLVAEELLAKEVLSRDDMVRLLGPRPWPESGEFTKYFGGPGTIAPPPPPSEALSDKGEGGSQSPSPA
ncbi:hypothetical protein VTO42DRAFT_1017 [Malbranchea cinnamomea]